MPVTRVGDLDMHWDRVGSGATVLLINGIGADRAAWGMQVAALSESYDVITFDNRDVGQTGAGENGADYSIAQFADDAAGLTEALGVERVHLIGASMGGAIAQEFAIRYPQRTHSLQIACSWARTDRWLFELMTEWDGIFASQGTEAWSRTTWLWVFTHRYYENRQQLASLIALAAENPHPQTAAMNLRQSNAFKQHDALARLDQIAVPTHVICGDEDIYTPLRYSIEIANAISGATLSVMAEVGHGMFWEATEEFNRLLLQFLADL